MKKLVLGSAGFIPLMLLILAVVFVIIVLAYLRVIHHVQLPHWR